MAVIKVPTNFNIELEFEIPEFYRRLIALIIDGIILRIYIWIANALFLSLLRNNDFSNDSLYDLSAWNLIFQLPVLLYHPAFEILMNGQSIGKKIMGLRVVNENGGQPSISQFLIRWLTRDIWFLGLIAVVSSALSPLLDSQTLVFVILLIISYFIIEIVLVVSSKKSQRIGDILAHTILIRTHQQKYIEDTVFQEVADNYVPSYPQIMRLSDKDINAIKSILENARRKGDFYMAENASDKIKQHLNIQSNLSPFDFLDTLLKDYNYLSVK